MTLALDLKAQLLAASPSRTRTQDADARALATRIKDTRKAAVIADAQRAAERFFEYTPEQSLRIQALRDVHWPRTRAVRNALSACDEMISRHYDKHDDYALSASELDSVIIRSVRLAHLVARTYAASAAIGRFPVSRADMRTDKRTRFIGSAAARHFTFAGGRDWGSSEFDPSDIVQGAFIRALANGDSVSGVPTFGSMFRHIQSERAYLTRMANAEYSARKRAALGWVTDASQHELEEMYPESKHTLRLLDTRNYASTSDHRKAIAIAHRDAEMSAMDDYVTASARTEALDGASDTEFHVIVSRVLMAGGTLDEIAESLGQRVETVLKDVFASRDASLRIIRTGIDHSERSVDMHNAAEREREEDEAEERHAARLRAIEATRATVHYAIGRVA